MTLLEVMRRPGSDPLKIAAGIVSMLLGILFLVSGFGKLYMVDEFSLTIRSVIDAPYPVCRIAAILVVAVEIIGGFFLLGRWKSALVAGTMLVLVAGFIIVLSSAIIRNHQLVCHCFGVFNLGLDNRAELILDLVMMDLFIFIILAGTGIPRRVREGKAMRRYAALLVILVGFYFEYLLFTTVVGAVAVLPGTASTLPGFAPDPPVAAGGTITRSTDESSGISNHPRTVKRKRSAVADSVVETMTSLSKEVPEDTPLLRFVAGRVPAFKQGNPGNRILLLVNFRDFDCHTCLEDFLSFTRDVDTIGHSGKKPVVAALFRKTPETEPAHRSEFEDWLTANSIRCPCFVLPDSVYASVEFERTTIVVLDNMNRVLFSRQFPLGEAGRIDALRSYNNM